VSVDTYLKGKDTSSYLRVERDGVEVLVSPTMAQWSRRVSLQVERGLLRRRLTAEVEHQHGPACRH
jgi:hypothetical protein